MERRPRPPREHALNCPRCQSTNTKFCYYNNYSLSQPRYFCKTCRRYWTEGGSLRNVPVGGGSRKNKRSSSSSKRPLDLPSVNAPMASTAQLSRFNQGHDLNLAAFQTQVANPALLGKSPFLLMEQDSYSGFAVQDFRSSSVAFPGEGIQGDGGYGGGRVLFPFEDLRRHLSGDADVDNIRTQGGDSSVFWNTVMGGGGASW